MGTLTNNINYKKDVIVNTIAQLLYLFALWLMTILTPRFGSSADAGIFTICFCFGKTLENINPSISDSLSFK